MRLVLKPGIVCSFTNRTSTNSSKIKAYSQLNAEVAKNAIEARFQEVKKNSEKKELLSCRLRAAHFHSLSRAFISGVAVVGEGDNSCCIAACSAASSRAARRSFSISSRSNFVRLSSI